GGNTTPFTIGASLLIVYRNPNDPFRAVVIYDGGFVLNQGFQSVTKTIKGFYNASNSNPEAKLSIVVGEGQDNFNEQVLLNGVVLTPTSTNPLVTATNPFVSDLGAAWDNSTFDNLHTQLV